MSKNLLIVSSYAKSKGQEENLKSCIKSLKPLGWDIMLMSHLPVPLEIQKEVTYFFYDECNPMLPPNEVPHIYLSTPHFDSKVYVSGHALAITRNMNTSFNFAKNLNYDFCYSIDYDFIFSETDLKKMIHLRTEMIEQDKKMIIFNPSEYIVPRCNYFPAYDDGPYCVETNFFGAEPNFFLENIRPPKDYSEWLENRMCQTLEISFYHKIESHFSDLLILDSFCKNYFTSSEINKNRYGLFSCEVVNNLKSPDNPVLLINNLGNDRYIKMYRNNDLINEFELKESSWFTYPLFYDNSVIVVEIRDEIDLHDDIKIFKMEETNREKFELAGEIIFK